MRPPDHLIPATLPGFEPALTQPRYVLAVAAHMEKQNGSKSWDLYRDVVAPAWDDVRDDVAELVGLTCAFIEHLTGEPLAGNARTMIAMGIKMHGKAMLYGIDQAMGHVDDPTDPTAVAKYARAVARNQVTRHRTRKAT